MADARSLPRRPQRRGHRGSGPAERVLFRSRQWRRLEDGRRRAGLDASVRRAAVASIGAIAVAPSSPDTVYAGSGESTLRDSSGFGNGVYKSTDAGKSWSHIGLEGTASHCARRGRSTQREHRLRRCDRPALCGQSRAWALPDPRWRQDVAEGPGQQRRRCGGGRDRSDQPAHRVRRTLEHPAPAVVHVRSDERPGRRHSQVHRRRRDVEAAHGRLAEGRDRQDRDCRGTEQSEAGLRGGGLPCP